MAPHEACARGLSLSPPEQVRANQQHNLNDGMALFPKLQRGLDVNVRFNKVMQT